MPLLKYSVLLLSPLFLGSTGNLVAAAAGQPLRPNVLFLVSDDMRPQLGYYMGEHSWWGGKHNNYEGATRAPLLIALPGQTTAGSHSPALVEFVDIYPSLVDLCGLPLPRDAAGLEGTSFVPLLSDPKRPWKKAAFSEYPKGGHQGTAMRTDRYRYVEWKNKQGEVVARELYDHQTDPQENENVADQPKQAATVRELGAMLKAEARGTARP